MRGRGQFWLALGKQQAGLLRRHVGLPYGSGSGGRRGRVNMLPPFGSQLRGSLLLEKSRVSSFPGTAAVVNRGAGGIMAGAPMAGVMSSQANSPRDVQLALKIIF